MSLSNSQKVLICVGLAILNYCFMPTPLRGVVGLFTGMAAGYYLARWDYEP